MQVAEVKEIKSGICPICNGSSQIELEEKEKRYSWNKNKTHKNCFNCGGQYMCGKPSGKVRLNKEGNPCVHKYVEQKIGRCYHSYTCKECGDYFTVDSGD